MERRVATMARAAAKTLIYHSYTPARITICIGRERERERTKCAIIDGRVSPVHFVCRRYSLPDKTATTRI